MGVDTVGAEGFGLTVIVKFLAGPEQPPELGVTVTVEVIGDTVAFAKVNDGMLLPEPDDPRPIPVALFDHVYVVPESEPEKLNVPEVAPAHFTWFAGTVTSGTDLIVIGALAEVTPHSLVTSSEIV